MLFVKSLLHYSAQSVILRLTMEVLNIEIGGIKTDPSCAYYMNFKNCINEFYFLGYLYKCIV